MRHLCGKMNTEKMENYSRYSISDENIHARNSTINSNFFNMMKLNKNQHEDQGIYEFITTLVLRTKSKFFLYLNISVSSVTSNIQEWIKKKIIPLQQKLKRHRHNQPKLDHLVPKTAVLSSKVVKTDFNVLGPTDFNKGYN